MLEAWLKLLNCLENHNDATKDLDVHKELNNFQVRFE